MKKEYDFSQNLVRGLEIIEFNSEHQLRLSSEIIPDSQFEIINIRMWQRFPTQQQFWATKKGVWISKDTFYREFFPKFIRILKGFDENVEEKLHKIIDKETEMAIISTNPDDITLKTESDL